MEENKKVENMTDEEIIEEYNKCYPAYNNLNGIKEDERTPQQKELIRDYENYLVELQREGFKRGIKDRFITNT